MFQISCGMANGVEAERHVPGLAGENREDRREFGAQHTPGSKRHEEHDGDRDKTQDRHRLENIEHRNEDTFGLLVLRRQRRIGEGEQQRQRHGDEHAQRRARGIFRQMARIERRRRALQVGERLEQMAARFAEEDQQPENQQNCQQIPPAEKPRPVAHRTGDEHAHVLTPGCHIIVA
jgi:hypothetical protein